MLQLSDGVAVSELLLPDTVQDLDPLRLTDAVPLPDPDLLVMLWLIEHVQEAVLVRLAVAVDIVVLRLAVPLGDAVNVPVADRLDALLLDDTVHDFVFDALPLAVDGVRLGLEVPVDDSVPVCVSEMLVLNVALVWDFVGVRDLHINTRCNVGYQ